MLVRKKYRKIHRTNSRHQTTLQNRIKADNFLFIFEHVTKLKYRDEYSPGNYEPTKFWEGLVPRSSESVVFRPAIMRRNRIHKTARHLLFYVGVKLGLSLKRRTQTEGVSKESVWENIWI
jgi:hypothetical protein